MAGLFESNAWVCVGPPLFAKGPSCAFRGDPKSPTVSLLTPLVKPDDKRVCPIKLWPNDVQLPLTSLAPFPAMMLFRAVEVGPLQPQLLTPFPSLAVIV